MKTIVYLGCMAVFCISFSYILSVRHKRNREGITNDITMKVTMINGESTVTKDKFPRPQICNLILLESIDESHRYIEINTCELRNTEIHIDKVWLYNHQVGDTVHFDYLRNERFFTIKPRSNEN